MLRLCFGKYRFAAGRFCALFLILTLCMTLFDAALQLFFQTRESARIIEENTTTLAIEQIVHELKNIDGKEQIVPVVYGPDVMNAARKSAAVIDVNETNTLFGRNDGLHPALPSYAAAVNHAYTQLGAEKTVVFHVAYNGGYIERNNWGGVWALRIRVDVLDVLEANPGFIKPKEVTVLYYGQTENDHPFEYGREFAVLGSYEPPAMLEGTHKVTKKRYYVEGNEMDRILEPGINGTLFFDNCKAIMPIDDPGVENMIALAEQSNHLFMVTGVSQTEGIPLFAMNEAFIKEGRDFTREELKNGEKVCLVSTAFASTNHLRVGDQMDLDLYRNGYAARTMYGGTFYSIAGMEKIKEPVEHSVYTIVGVYQTVEWGLNKFCFPPSTVFVPRDSLKVQGVKGVDFADSLVLHNGSSGQFLQDVKDAGIRDGVYAIYDGGYSQYMTSLKSMQKDALMVLLVCALLYTVMTFAALSVIAAYLRKDAFLLRQLGAAPGYARSYTLLCMLPVLLLSAFSAYSCQCIIRQPMMTAMEKWYTLSRPVYSNLTANTLGMITQNMAPLPSPLGAGTALIIACMLMLPAIYPRAERRKA